MVDDGEEFSDTQSYENYSWFSLERHSKLDKVKPVKGKGKKKKKKKKKVVDKKKRITRLQKEYRIDKEYWRYLRVQVAWQTFGGLFISSFEFSLFILAFFSMDAIPMGIPTIPLII